MKLPPPRLVLKSPVFVPRKSPTERVYQQDQSKLFEEQDKIKSLYDIDSTATPKVHAGIQFQNMTIVLSFTALTLIC